jgi:hypothetical protein
MTFYHIESSVGLFSLIVTLKTEYLYILSTDLYMWRRAQNKLDRVGNIFCL